MFTTVQVKNKSQSNLFATLRSLVFSKILWCYWYVVSHLLLLTVISYLKPIRKKCFALFFCLNSLYQNHLRVCCRTSFSNTTCTYCMLHSKRFFIDYVLKVQYFTLNQILVNRYIIYLWITTITKNINCYWRTLMLIFHQLE